MASAARAEGPLQFRRLTPDHPAVGEECPICHIALKAGDLPRLIRVARTPTLENLDPYGGAVCHDFCFEFAQAVGKP